MHLLMGFEGELGVHCCACKERAVSGHGKAGARNAGKDIDDAYFNCHSRSQRSLVLIVVRSRSKRQRKRPDPAKRVGLGLRSQIGPLARRGSPAA